MPTHCYDTSRVHVKDTSQYHKMAAPDHGPAVATKEDNDEASQLVDAFTAAMPPAMAKQRDYSTDELLKEMNKVPLFMTSIDENDEEQAAQLEAMRAIAYEGTRAEIATNFKAQGNECVQEKDWFNAREYYSKAITALRDPDLKKYESPDAKVIELDEEAEAAEQRLLEEVCLANRALCNLEMSITACMMNRCFLVANNSPRELWIL